MKQFNYLAPKTLPEALQMLADYKESAVLFNGGTDVVVRLRDRLIAPDYVVDIKRIPGLDNISFDEQNGLTIGACATMNAIGENEAVCKHYPFLAKAALSVGSRQVRNRATCIGNICNASPLADTGTPLLACDAVILAEGPDGRREIPIRDFFIFVRKTSLKPDEIVTAIRVPYIAGAEGVFTKVARRREVDLSTVCATVLRCGGEFRFAFGSVAPTPLRLVKTEELVRGKKPDAALIEQAVELARSEVAPISDVRASKEYRMDIVGLIVRRGLETLAK